MSDFALQNAFSQRNWPPERPCTAADLSRQRQPCDEGRTLARRQPPPPSCFGISKLRQKATLIFRAKAPHLRAHIKQSNACPHTHRSSCSKCSKPAASQQHVGIGTVIDSACSIGNRELKSSEGTAVASAVLFHQPPSSSRTRESAGPKRPARSRLVPLHAETSAKGHFDISS